MSKLIEFPEATTHLPAEKMFVRRCQFDLATQQHRRMMQEARRVRERDLGDLPIRVLLSYYGPECFQKGSQENAAYLKLEGETITCDSFAQVPEDQVVGIYAYILTAGDWGLSDSSDSEKEITDLVYADLWGSSYVDVGRDLLNAYLRRDVNERFGREEAYSLSPEFGPGFFSMPVEELRTFHRILEGEKIGCTMGKNGTLLPQKSCTGLFFVLRGSRMEVEPACIACQGVPGGCGLCKVRE